jgi:hypothetical protein
LPIARYKREADGDGVRDFGIGVIGGLAGIIGIIDAFEFAYSILNAIGISSLSLTACFEIFGG